MPIGHFDELIEAEVSVAEADLEACQFIVYQMKDYQKQW